MGKKMRRKYIAPLITLLALSVTSILNVIYRIDLYHSTLRLLLVFVIFYIIGKIAAGVIVKGIHADELAKLAEEELKEIEQQTEETSDTV